MHGETIYTEIVFVVRAKFVCKLQRETYSSVS